MAAVTSRSLLVPPFGVNLFGHVTGNLGLGVAARTTATILDARGVPTVLTDVDPGMGRAGHDTTHAVLAAEHADRTRTRSTSFT